MFAMILASLLWGGEAYAGVVTTCYANAENDNPGLSVEVKLGAVIQYSGADLDTAFDKIAQYHANTSLSVSYNTEGKAALRQAMDCIFDNDHFTLSSVVLNRLDPQLEVRAYDVREFNSSLQLVATYWFSARETIAGGDYMRFNSANGDCISFETVALPPNDEDRPLPNPPTTRCRSHDCEGDCSPDSSGDGSCGCSEDGGCAGVQKPGEITSGNGAIVRVVLDP